MDTYISDFLLKSYIFNSAQLYVEIMNIYISTNIYILYSMYKNNNTGLYSTDGRKFTTYLSSSSSQRNNIVYIYNTLHITTLMRASSRENQFFLPFI